MIKVRGRFTSRETYCIQYNKNMTELTDFLGNSVQIIEDVDNTVLLYRDGSRVNLSVGEYVVKDWNNFAVMSEDKLKSLYNICII